MGKGIVAPCPLLPLEEGDPGSRGSLLVLVYSPYLLLLLLSSLSRGIVAWRKRPLFCGLLPWRHAGAC